MAHRIVLVGHPVESLAPLESALRRLHQSVLVTKDASQTAALARQFAPSVVLIAGEIGAQATSEALGVLLSHPATTALPVLILSAPPAPEAALDAFQGGVSDLCPAGSAEDLVARLDLVLGSAHDTARRAAAIDRRGPAMLRRVGRWLRACGHTGALEVRWASGEASLGFVAGEVRATAYGALRGDEALAALLASADEAPWRFSFIEGQAPATAAAAQAIPSLPSEAPVVELLAEVDAEAPREGAAPRLLLVDDDESLLVLYRRFFERAGFVVSTERNGKAGFQAVLRERHDVVVSDIMMPETDGWALLTLVREDYRTRETRFLLLSCHGDYVAKLRHLDAGADDYLAKGARGDEVVARVEAALAPRRQTLARLCATAPCRGALAPVGVQTLLCRLSELEATGALVLGDGVARYEVSLARGRVVATRVTSGSGALSGREALLSLLQLDDAPFLFTPSATAPAGEGARFEDMREALAEELNAARDRARDQMLVEDARLVFKAEALAFYRLVCPAVVRPVLEELGAGAAPRALMGSGVASPVVVEWVVKDLLRKGIARFDQK